MFCLLRGFNLILLLLTYIRNGIYCYDLIHDFSGSSFFDGWGFYGSWDNLTLGDTWWVNENDAFQQGLAYINGAGNAILKVDNTTNVPLNEKRNSVRITTNATYNFGSLWIIDVVHLPFGCSVWPAFWSFGANWPAGGEIDIIEGINLMTNNQAALHTLPGCVISSPSSPATSSGKQIEANCSTPSGCTILDTRSQSYGATFAASGGGVWATQYDVSGIFIWFWPRASVPSDILETPLDISSWGPPTASYPNSSTCAMMDFFTPQQLVLDITLCGVWAGLPAAYNATCAGTGPTGLCYNDNVIGPPSHYDDAYFELSYVKAFTTAASAPTGQVIHTGSMSRSSRTCLHSVLLLLCGPLLSLFVAYR